jgi:hypothetical protein
MRVQECLYLFGESEKLRNAVIGGERLADVSRALHRWGWTRVIANSQT